MNVRALLVKTFARDTSELRGGFEPVPAGMSLAQGLAMLDLSLGPIQTDGRQQPPARSGSMLLAPAFAVRR